MKVIEFDNVSCAYAGGPEALKDVSITVGKGEVVGLLGRNGAGKTTLMRIAMGMLRAQRGAARIFGLDPREHPVEVKRRIGFVAEDQIIPTFMRVREVMEMHRRLFPAWDVDAAAELARRFDLSPTARVGALSKGQARQVALLCAVAHRPHLLLLDEPAGGLDPAARREFLETSIQLLNEAGSTIVFSSHHLTDVERMAQRVVLIHHGAVLVDSELDGLREGYTMALIPESPGITVESLSAHQECVAARVRHNAVHAVFHRSPDETERLLKSQLGLERVTCRSVALEEMFIELVEGQR